MVVVFIVLFFLFTSYSANIVALLQSPSNKIKTLKDLLRSRLELGVHDTVYNRYFFTVSIECIEFIEVQKQNAAQKDNFFLYSA